MNRALRINSDRKAIRLSLACCAAILLATLTACGQRGPLFLPEEAETQPATAGQAVENGQETGAEEDDDGASR